MDQALSVMEEVQRTERQSLNILLLGPTGVGKSTFINALANYLTFNTVEEALQHDLVSLIHSEFTVSDNKDNKRVQTKISVGVPDADEKAQKVGGSCTQRCKAYRFPIDETQSIRLIDTPGIGDTRGPDQDRENMKNTLSFLSQYEVLHAVCILLKPNESRLTVSLRYCIVQLLEKLHIDASRNILFCFTNTRGTFYKVENTYGLIETMLKPTREDKILLDIQLEDLNTMYCFDSEAFRFCAAVKKGVCFDDSEKRSFVGSWEKSTEEAFRLIKHIGSLPPHVVESTVSLNRVRSMLETLERPLEIITAAMQANMDASKKAQFEIEQSHGTYLDKSKLLYVQETTTETVVLPQPRLMCTEPECRRKACHDSCHLNETAVEKVKNMVVDTIQNVPLGPFRLGALSPFFSGPASTGDSTRILRRLLDTGEDFVFCQKLSLRLGKCTVCGHPNGKHNREKSQLRTVTHSVKDPAIEKILAETNDEAEQKKKVLKVHQDKEATIEKEIGVVLKAAALFAGFIEQNSIVTYHSATATYFRNQISERKRTGDQSTAEGAKQIEQLQKFLKTYEDKVRHFKKSNAGTDSNKLITEDEIKLEIQNLYALKEYGPHLKEWMNGVESEFAFERAKAKARGEVDYNSPVYPVNPQQLEAGASRTPRDAAQPENPLSRIGPALRLRGNPKSQHRSEAEIQTTPS